MPQAFFKKTGAMPNLSKATNSSLKDDQREKSVPKTMPTLS